MTGAQEDFLAAARSAARLLSGPELTAAWGRPSALPEFGVAALAGHLAYQVLCVRAALAEPAPVQPCVPLLEHYRRVAWIGAAPDEDINVRIRQGGAETASRGQAALVRQVEALLGELPGILTAEDGERPVRLPFWGPWSLTLDDLLTTRVMELAVHSDDLAVSIGAAAPDLPPGTMERVIGLLARLAARRHGPVNVLRALSRAERAPRTIAAF
ncbi:maleylpyruvate isomerase N-terminal domain-containing protein [Streptomyces orinoci]|uniref:Maleylpyruvate isomerase N-terminal domain-containing protein n=1 Tax=Streptomyces orinoci TaxID=67339 RepID=A0ABV3K4R0_STRON|nr:maleylpyruvate isomerase N-terminal domain-containing protein [Streptomyces orinoci]